MLDVANINEANVTDSIANIADIANIAKILEDFCNRWGNGDDAFDQSNYIVDRNRQIGIPKLAFIAAAMDPRTKNLYFFIGGRSSKSLELCRVSAKVEVVTKITRINC